MPEISMHSQWEYCSKLFQVLLGHLSLVTTLWLLLISRFCGSLNYFSESQYHWCQFWIHRKLLTLIARHGFNKYIFLHLVVKWWRWWWCLALRAMDAFVITTQECPPLGMLVIRLPLIRCEGHNVYVIPSWLSSTWVNGVGECSWHWFQ